MMAAGEKDFRIWLGVKKVISSNDKGKVGAGNLAKNRTYLEVKGDDTTETAQGYEFYKIFIIIQSIILLITSAYITIKLVCRKKSTPRKIQIALIAGGVAGIILTIIRMIYANVPEKKLFKISLLM